MTQKTGASTKKDDAMVRVDKQDGKGVKQSAKVPLAFMFVCSSAIICPRMAMVFYAADFRRATYGIAMIRTG